MKYLLNEKGFIKSLNGKKSINFNSDNIYIITEKETYNLNELNCKKENNDYIYETKDALFKIHYEEKDNFLKRFLSIKFKEKTTLLKIGFSIDKYEETFLYNTFINGSGAVFARNGETGLYLGFENPYFYLSGNNIEFEPSLILEANEIFDCDVNFIGIYELWGEKVSQEINYSTQKTGDRYWTRFRNPGEGILLYFSEIYEFNEYTKTFFETDKKPFKYMSYNNFSNMPDRPNNEEKEIYFTHIDNCAKLGIDLIVLNPLCENSTPNEDINSYWELFPPNTNASEIYEYAKNKGLEIGMYLGVSENAFRCNSPLLNYSNNPSWKKIDIHNNISGENCLCSKDFYDWYLQVIKNTIKKYNLKLWNWDPGPGDGLYCYSQNHGHIPGKGDYKGYRESLRIMKELKEEFPDLYILGFYGNKKYGLWGFKYIDQQEGYWEIHICCDIPIYEDLSAERLTANNVRFQSNWNYYFRFMHQTLNHGLATRMTQDCAYFLEVDCDKLFDYSGYKYSLLSSIASGGSITLPIIPREMPSEFIDFYKYWIKWSKDNWEYSKNTIPFGAQVGVGIEGYSKLIHNKGYIFLINPFYKPLDFSFELNERIGFTQGETYINTIYPNKNLIQKGKYGDTINISLEEYSVVVLELSNIPCEKTLSINNDLPTYIPLENGNGSFFANPKIREIISSYKIDDSIIEIGDKLNHSNKYATITNTMWYRPDRLWLCVYNEGEMPLVSLNGENIPLTWEKYLSETKLSYFADITDKVKWNENNVITTNKGEIYLHYPIDTGLCNKGYKLKNREVKAPILDKSIKITEAIINNDNVVYPNKKNVLKCKVNMDYNELEGVYATPVMAADRLLAYEDGYWVYEFTPPSRIHYILDDSKIAIWAVSKDRKESETYYLKINWSLNEKFAPLDKPALITE